MPPGSVLAGMVRNPLATSRPLPVIARLVEAVSTYLVTISRNVETAVAGHGAMAAALVMVNKFAEMVAGWGRNCGRQVCDGE